MNKNSITGTSLASDVVDRIIALDELLKLVLTDQDDHAELQERMAALDPSEVKHILATFGVKSAAVAESPVEVWVAADEAEDVKG